MRNLVVSAATMLQRRVAGVVRLVLRSFQTKLMALVLLSVLVPTGVIWILTVRDTEKFQTDQIQQKFASVLHSAHLKINYWYQDKKYGLKTLLQSEGFVKLLRGYYGQKDPATRGSYELEIAEYFRLVNEKYPGYEDFVVLDEDGRVIIGGSAMADEEVELLRSFKQRSAEQLFVGPHAFTAHRREVYQWVLVPVEVSADEQATVCVRMNLAELTALLAPKTADPAAQSPASDLYLLDVGDLYLLDRDGFLMTQPKNAPYETNMIGHRAKHVPVVDENRNTPVVLRYAKETLSPDGKRRKKKYLASRLFLSDYKWWLVCEAQENRVIAPVVTRKNRLLLANVFICAFFLLVAWKTSRYLLSPLSQLSIGAKRINDGMVGVKIPVTSDDEIGGMISAFNEMAERITLDEAKLKAQYAELSRTNAKLHTLNERLEQLSVTDGLTGLFNHRHFWHLMNDQLGRVDSYTGKLGLVLLDIDNFKQVNDQFGHSTGDRLIQRISEILKETVRETDLVARYGGEEFAVLLPDIGHSGLLLVSEKIRCAVEQTVFKVPETDITISITISVGVSLFAGDRKEFFNAADRALYTSKAEGKNKVNFAVAAN